MSRLVMRTWLGYQCSSSGVFSGQPRIENGHSALENHVSSVSSSRRSSVAWKSRLRDRARFFFRLRDDRLIVGRVPDRQAMAPPDLARDVPVADVFQPRLVGAAEAFGDEADAAVAIGVERRLRERVHLAEPLQRQQRLDDGAAARAHRHAMAVRFDRDERAGGLEVGDDAFARREAVEARVGRAGRFRHARVKADDRERVEVVAFADLVV